MQSLPVTISGVCQSVNDPGQNQRDHNSRNGGDGGKLVGKFLSTILDQGQVLVYLGQGELSFF